MTAGCAADPAVQALWHRFKTGTAAQHRRVEQCFPILAPGLTLTQYRSWLARLHGFYVPLEQRLERFAAPMDIEWPARIKGPRLRADLLYLGLSPAAIDGVPLCTDLPEVQDPAAAFGAAYVLEGATLGGRLIAGRLRARLGVEAARGAAFFSAYGEEVDARWLAFRLRLAAAVAAPEDERRALAAARETFETLGDWLAGAGTERAAS